MKNIIRTGLLSILSVLSFTACESYPGYDDYTTEQLVTISSYNTSANFNNYKTFNVYDSIIIINNNEVSKVRASSSSELQQLYNNVKNNLAEINGYTFQDSKNTDMGVFITLVKTTTIEISYPYWWNEYCYWYYWDCGYYPYYPYSYPVVVGGYTTGTIIMDMFDLKEQHGSKKTALWTGAVRGLMTGEHTDTEINNAIQECFEQTVPFQKK